MLRYHFVFICHMHTRFHSIPTLYNPHYFRRPHPTCCRFRPWIPRSGRIHKWGMQALEVRWSWFLRVLRLHRISLLGGKRTIWSPQRLDRQAMSFYFTPDFSGVLQAKSLLPQIVKMKAQRPRMQRLVQCKVKLSNRVGGTRRFKMKRQWRFIVTPSWYCSMAFHSAYST